MNSHNLSSTVPDDVAEINIGASDEQLLPPQDRRRESEARGDRKRTIHNEAVVFR